MSDLEALVTLPTAALDLDRKEELRFNVHRYPILWSHPRMRSTLVVAAATSVAVTATSWWLLAAERLDHRIKLTLFVFLLMTLVSTFFARLRSKAILRGEAHDIGSARLLSASTDGELVRLRGIARALDGRSVAGFPDFVFVAEITPSKTTRDFDLVVDRAVEFLLVDEGGASVLIDVANARYLHGIERVGDPTAVGVRIGDRIEVIGRKGRRVDQSMERMERDMPERATIGESKNVPLLIIPIGLPSRYEEGKFASILERQKLLSS